MRPFGSISSCQGSHVWTKTKPSRHWAVDPPTGRGAGRGPVLPRGERARRQRYCVRLDSTSSTMSRSTNGVVRLHFLRCVCGAVAAAERPNARLNLSGVRLGTAGRGAKRMRGSGARPVGKRPSPPQISTTSLISIASAHQLTNANTLEPATRTVAAHPSTQSHRPLLL